MKNLNKAAKMASLAFLNGIRLHRDSISMYKNGSLPSALQLSILAQEEIGKAFILEEHIFRSFEHKSDGNWYVLDPKIQSWLKRDLVSHKSKQIWFSREANPFPRKYRKKYIFSKFIDDATDGSLELLKEDVTYVGLTRMKEHKKEIDLNGKIVDPFKRAKRNQVIKHITRVNDFIITLIEGCRKGVYTVETDELDKVLKINLAKKLEKIWPRMSLDSLRRLKQIRRI